MAQQLSTLIQNNIAIDIGAIIGNVPILRGGTGATTAAGALTSLGAYASSNPSGYTTNTGTVTSVAALTLGTTGTDVTSTVATGSTTPIVTLNLPTASASNRGALSADNWTTFNGKQAALGFTPENVANKGAASGYAPLDATSKISSTYLPSYVDDVLEYANLAALPVTGTAGLIYVTVDTNKTYRWSGSAYVEISASPGSTDAVTEGTTNLYFTNTRARASISATQNITYNSTTGVITGPVLSGYLTSYTETDTLQSVTSRGITTRASSGTFAANGQGTPGLEIYGGGTTEPSYMTFHRPGIYAVKFGLDGTDLKVGGWSMGPVSYKLWHEGNLTNLNQLTNGPGYISSYTETDTLQSVTTRGATTTSSIGIGTASPLGLLDVNKFVTHSYTYTSKAYAATTWYRFFTFALSNQGQQATIILRNPGGHDTVEIKLAKHTVGLGELGYVAEIKRLGSFAYTYNMIKIRVCDDGTNAATHLEVQLGAATTSTLNIGIHGYMNTGFTTPDMTTGTAGTGSTKEFIISDGVYGTSNQTVWGVGTAARDLLYIKGTGNVGIGTNAPTSMLTVAGQIESTVTGYKFPDGTVQASAATGAPTLVIVSATTQTAASGNHYVLTNAAASTLTLPASPVAGNLIYVTSGNGLATNVIAYNGNKIMGLSENLTINTTAYTTMQLRYLNATIGWALI